MQTCLVKLLLNMRRAESAVSRDEATDKMLHVCQWNAVYYSLVSCQVLEIVILGDKSFGCYKSSILHLTLESSSRASLKLKKAKGKEIVLSKISSSLSLEGPQKGEISLVLNLKLRNQLLFL
jgi:hypothetical protein